MTSLLRRTGAFSALMLIAGCVHAQTYLHQVYLDRDQDPGTGCSVATAAGTIVGVDSRLTATIAQYPATVQGLTLATCAGGSFGAESAVAGGYAVGYDVGVGGADVIELAVDLAALGGATGSDWTLWFASSSVSTGGIDLVGPVTASGLGTAPAPTPAPQPAIIPALDAWGLLLLSLALGVAVVWTARRHRGLLPVLLVGAALSVAGVAWAANYLLDGSVADWDGGPLATDPTGDMTTDEPPADLTAVFAAREGARVFFRSDVAEAQVEKLITGLLSTAFTVDENPANGTVVGELRAVTTGLGSLLQFQLLGQTPANAFAVDADGTLTVADGSLVDAESTPVFTLDVQVSVNGVAALTIQVDVTVTVDGVNEAPVVDAATFSIPEDSADGTAVGTVTFTDPDVGQAHTFAITAGDAGGVFAIDAGTGAITVADSSQLDFATTPSYSLTVTVTDNGTPALSGSATITVDITETDDPPVAVDDAATVAEDAPATAIDVLANDTDTDAGPMTVQSVTQPANGTVVITGGGTGVTYAPNADYCNDSAPVDSFTYTLNGGSSATVSVTVTCVDDDPVAVADAAAVTEDDTATSILVLANDTDVDAGAAMSIASVTQPANGAVTIAGDSLSLSYTPSADYCNDGSPVDTFTYTLAPGGSTATVSVTVTCVDDLPVAVDDAVIVAEDSGANTLDVLANDTDVDGGPITVQLVTQPANGAVAITNGGADLSYAPNLDYCNDGSPVDTFTYTLNGGSSATVSVTIPCGDDPPIAVADTATVAEDDPATTIDVLANDTDVDAGPMVVQSVTQPANGTVVITNAGADLTYAPNADYCNNGSPLDTFTYTLNGGSTATVSVTVTCANDAPLIDLDADDDKGTGGTDFAVSFTENDGPSLLQDADDPTGAIITDVDSATLVSLTVTLTNLFDAGEELLDADVSAFAPDITKSYDTATPGVGVLTISSITPQPIADYVAVLRTVTYDNTSDAPDTTTRSVQFVANDGSLASNVATAFVSLSGVDTAPVAVDDAATVAEDDPATAIAVLGNDTDDDGGPISIASVTQPTNGTVVITGGGTGLTYQPSAEYCNSPPGTTLDTFTYTLAPGGDTATVSVTVTCADDNPTAVADAATVTEDSGANAIDVLANDTDPDGGLLEVQSVTLPANGTVAITGGGTGVSYTPNADYCNDPPGTSLDSFTYTLNGGSSTTVTVTVTCVEDDPVAVADAATVAEDSGANAIDVMANDTDPDGGSNSIASVTQPTNGSVAITGGGTGVSYTPNAEYCNNPPGTTLDTFTYTLAPGGSSTTVTVTVTCVDDPPVAVADAATVLEDAGASAIDVLANDTDIDGGPKTVQSVTQPANGTVAITGGGTGVTYAPNANYCNDGSPLDTFTYTLNGGSSTTVSMTVTCVNDPPTVSGSASAAVHTHIGISVPDGASDLLAQFTVNDVDGPTPIVIGGTLPSLSANGGEVSVNAATGAFTYNPPANFAGADAFAVQFCDSDPTPACSAPQTVTLNVAGPEVWFVDDDAVFTGTADGTLQQPFQTLAAAATAANQSGNRIFVHSGSYTGGVTLANGVLLYGHAAGSGATNDDEFHEVLGITPVTHGVALPAVNQAVPQVSVGGAASGVTFGSGNTIDGVHVQTTASTATGIAGTSLGTLTVDEASVAGTGRALNLNGGTLTGAFTSVSSSGGANNVLLQNLAGSIDLGTGALSGATAEALFVSGGTLGLSYAGSLANASAGGRTLAVTGHATGTITLSGTIQETGSANGLLFANADGSYQLTGVLTLQAAQGIVVASGSSGTINASNAGSAITNPTSNAVWVSGSAPTLTYSGGVTKTNNNTIAIRIENNTGGSITLNGATKTLSTGTANAVNFVNNAGATLTFTGGNLDIDTTTGVGFNATGGGTVTVQGTNNSISSVSGTALNVSGTTIGASGLTFQRIDSGNATAAADPANGILLNATGTLGGLTVTGTGATGSGGTIRNTSGDGISLANTSGVSLSRMVVIGAGDDGIDGSGVVGLSIDNSSISNNGNAANEEGISLVNVSGAVALTNVIADQNGYNNLRLDNTTGTISSLAITGGSYSNNSQTTGNHGILMEIRGTSVLTSGTISGATISDNFSIGVQAVAGDSATVSNLTISGNTFTGTLTGATSGTQEIAVDCSKSQVSNMTCNIVNNLGILNHNSHGINVATAAGGDTGGILNARVAGNTIGNAATAFSGSNIGNGIRVSLNGQSSNRVLVANNTIRQFPNGRGIEVQGRNGTGGSDVTVTGNTIDGDFQSTPQNGGFELASIVVQSNCVTVCNTVRTDVRSNNVPAATDVFDFSNTHIILVESSTSTLELVDSTSPVSGTCVDELAATNTGSTSVIGGCSLIAGPITTPP